jgi:YesN/AraC family two-component response regulator
MLDLEILDIQGNSLYWLSPGQLHDFTLTEPIEGYRISFSSSFLQMNGGLANLPFTNFGLENLPEKRIIQIGQEVQSEVEEVVKTMVWEYSNHLHYHSEILKGLLKIFITYVSQKFEFTTHKSNSGSDHELFNRFMQSLETNYSVKKSVANYADEFAVTPNYLSEVIKKVSGFTGSHHIQQRIVIEAKRALICTGGTMKEIAFQLGFIDAAHFSKFYKNVTGENFSEYRSKGREAQM